jgi:hypothetical protein
LEPMTSNVVISEVDALMYFVLSKTKKYALWGICWYNWMCNVCVCVYIYIYNVAYINKRISLYITCQISHLFHNFSPIYSALFFQTLELRNFPWSEIQLVPIPHNKTLPMRRSGMSPGNSELSSKQTNSTSPVQYGIHVNHKRLFWRPIKHYTVNLEGQQQFRISSHGRNPSCISSEPAPSSCQLDRLTHKTPWP